ncbi:MAG: hypothetical protein J0L54_08300 [Chitinophagales bacterium]|nr:hypothetical protein [Chitinophagales bacterium]
MEFVPIFGSTDKFWCPVYEQDNGDDLFTVLFDKWTDTEYLKNFFIEHKADLTSPYWNGINIDKAIQLVLEEITYLQEKLICIEDRHDECDGVEIEDIFEDFRDSELIFKGSQRKFKKGKIDSYPKFLRLYGVELEDGTILITGGAIKISFELERNHIKDEIKRMKRVANYLKAEFIHTKEGLY